MTGHYQSLAEKPFDSHYTWTEIDIDAPVSVVFARARRISEWMKGHVIETIDGTPGEAGHFERVLPRDLAPGTPQPHHHVYGIAHLIPDRYIGMEVFHEHGGSYGKARGWISLDGVILTELDPNRTRVAFLLVEIYDGRSTPGVAAELAAELEQLSSTLLTPYLQTLKAQAEGDVRA
jgi:hypothetical protein